MHTGDQDAAERLRPRTPARVPPRRRLNLALYVAAALALLPAFLWLAPASEWDDPVLLVALWSLAVITDRHEVPLPGGIGFDALLALTLLTVALAGPLPALGIIVAPVLANAVTGREPALRINALGNVAGYGWQAIAAALTLERLLPAGAGTLTALAALIVAGGVIYVVGWAIGPVLYATLWLGRPLRELTRAFVDMLPAGVVMIVLGAATVLATQAYGLLALAGFAAIAILPQSALTYAARSRPVARLEPSTATRRYARALAIELGLSRAERREVVAVARVAIERRSTGDAMEHIAATLSDPSGVSCAAGHVSEWWNGAGGPAGLPGELCPLSARVVAVAQTWSALTAAGTPQLSHREALADLQSAAGTRLDPGVVRAARAVIAQERVTDAEPAPEPRLHTLHVPATLRRLIASAG
jgi:hypothetical protein